MIKVKLSTLNINVHEIIAWDISKLTNYHQFGKKLLMCLYCSTI